MGMKFFTCCFFSLVLAGFAPLFPNDWAFSGVTPGGHRGAVTAIIHNGNTIISAGEDGFLEIWDTGSGRAGDRVGKAADRFQVSLYGITTMAQRPEKNEICLIESDKLGYCRISAWNYRERRNIFTLHFNDPKSYITYSTGGNFIIAAGTGRASLVFIDSATGQILRSPEFFTGTITLAVTGKSDRTMVTYSPSGELSYLDIVSGNVTSRFKVPANLHSPVLFGNSRYLAGVNREGLVIVNAVSGELTATDNTVYGDSLLYSLGNDFFCMIRSEEETELRRYTINNNGRLVTLGRFPLPRPASGRYTAAGFNGAAGGLAGGLAVLGTSGGSLAVATLNSQTQGETAVQTLTVNEKTRIIDAAVTGTVITFLTENGTLGFIPRRYTSFSDGITLNIEKNGNEYNRITAFSGGNTGDGHFILWQDKNNRTQPLLRSSDPAGGLPVPGSRQFPVRSVSSFGGKVLFLDSAGNLSVSTPLDSENNRPFIFSSVGLIDAAFVDSEKIILTRSAVSGSTPFLLLNINTGETVPVPYPSLAGVAVHRGMSGKIYAAVVSPPSGTMGNEDAVVTSIIQLNPANSAESVTFAEFQGEAAYFSLAESQGCLVVTVGDESVILSSPKIAQKPARTPGLPLRFIDDGSYLVSIDNDGNICWHESRSGTLLAVFSLQPAGWMLQTAGRTISGRVETSD